jgi:hypothetical protein
MQRGVRIAALLVGAGLVLTLSGCTGFAFLFGEPSTSPQADLVGEWIINSAGGAADTTGYKAFQFPGDDTFTITNVTDEVIETNTMTEVTSTSFVGNITQQTIDPSLVGTATFAEYEISVWNESTFLRIVFYDDDTKAVRFVTFVCEKL